MSTVLERVREAAYRTRLKYPGDTDAMKACRAIAGLELGLVELCRDFTRKTALQILDKGGSGQTPMFNVSERHIRRVETIRKKRPLDAARLEGIAMRGTMSLELVEYNVNHPPTADALEAMWLTSSDQTRKEFLARIREA